MNMNRMLAVAAAVMLAGLTVLVNNVVRPAGRAVRLEGTKWVTVGDGDRYLECRFLIDGVEAVYLCRDWGDLEALKGRILYGR